MTQRFAFPSIHLISLENAMKTIREAVSGDYTYQEEINKRFDADPIFKHFKTFFNKDQRFIEGEKQKPVPPPIPPKPKKCQSGIPLILSNIAVKLSRSSRKTTTTTTNTNITLPPIPNVNDVDQLEAFLDTKEQTEEETPEQTNEIDKLTKELEENLENQEKDNNNNNLSEDQEEPKKTKKSKKPKKSKKIIQVEEEEEEEQAKVEEHQSSEENDNKKDEKSESSELVDQEQEPEKPVEKSKSKRGRKKKEEKEKKEKKDKKSKHKEKQEKKEPKEKKEKEPKNKEKEPKEKKEKKEKKDDKHGRKVKPDGKAIKELLDKYYETISDDEPVGKIPIEHLSLETLNDKKKEDLDIWIKENLVKQKKRGNLVDNYNVSIVLNYYLETFCGFGFETPTKTLKEIVDTQIDGISLDMRKYRIIYTFCKSYPKFLKTDILPSLVMMRAMQIQEYFETRKDEMALWI